jgi:hypothetical protein
MEKSAFRKGMETTTWILAGATVLLVAVFWISGASWILSAAISIGTTLYHFAMRLAVGFFIPLCIKKYDCQNWWFRPRKWETVFYRKLQVKKWKKHLPTFDPKKFSTEIYTLPQIVQNMCEAEIVHEIIVVFSFLPLAAVPVFGEFPVFLITSLAAGLFDCVFIIAQRYNRPRIIRLMQKGAKGP